MRTTEPTQVDPEEWPTYVLECAFNPREAALPPLAPDELVVFDPGATCTRWISATRGDYVAVEDAR